MSKHPGAKDFIGAQVHADVIVSSARVLVRQPFAYDADAVSQACGLDCGTESRTKQEFKEECDLNVLVKRFGITGQMPPNHRVAMYQDFDRPMDFHAAQTAIAEAREAFMAMPPDVRGRFGNDPQALMDFIGDERNREEVKRMGLMAPEEAATAPILVKMAPGPEAVNPTPGAAPGASGPPPKGGL